MAQRGRGGEKGTDFFPALISVSLDEGAGSHAGSVKVRIERINLFPFVADGGG